MISFPPKLGLAMTPTPLEPLDRLSEQVGGPRIWVKRDDMTGSAISGNKVRKLEFVLAEALAGGADTLITCGGLQSNHCRATALLGARLGLKVHLILRGELEGLADGNLFLNQLAGAEISAYPRREYQKRLPELMQKWQEHYREQGHNAFLIPTGASDYIGVWGYVNCARELSEQIAEQRLSPTAIIHATGSGGTQAGLTAGVALFVPGVDVIGMAVCDDEAYFQNKVAADLRDWQQVYGVGLDTASLTVRVNDKYIGPGYAAAEPAVFAAIRRVAALEGLVLDPVYTGKAFHGMLKEIERGAYAGASDLIFVHTGGIFGLLAQRDQVF